MNLLVRLAWRNVWRNRRRTFLTALAGVFAVVLTLFSLSQAAGSHERWLDQAVRLYPGHVEVSARGYREHRTLDYGMTLDPAQARALEALPAGAGWAPRLETWALALPDRDDGTGRAAWLVGIDPEREPRVSRLGESLRRGRLPAAGANEVVLGAHLAANLGLDLGGELILLASDYYGSQAADRFTLVGVLEVGDPRMDDAAALVALPALQSFLEDPGGLTHVALFARDSDAAAPLEARAREIFGSERFEVAGWRELVPDVVEFMLLDDVSNYVVIAILIVVVAFGLLNTILMSTFERVREFGVMRAIGVRRPAILVLVLCESLVISALGIAAGLAIGVPLVLWLVAHPIELTGEAMRASSELFGIEPLMLFKLVPAHLVWLPATLLGVGLAAALPPALRASRGRPVDALREG